MSRGAAGLWVRPGRAECWRGSLQLGHTKLPDLLREAGKEQGPGLEWKQETALPRAAPGSFGVCGYPGLGSGPAQLRREENLGCVRVGHRGESGYRVTVEPWDLRQESRGTIPHPSLEHSGGFVMVAITLTECLSPC